MMVQLPTRVDMESFGDFLHDFVLRLLKVHTRYNKRYHIIVEEISCE